MSRSMTDTLPATGFSRRDLLKSGGALVVGFSLAGLPSARAETGGPPVKTPTRQGFGGKVIRGMIEQLKGRTRFDWRPEGLVCEITFQA